MFLDGYKYWLFYKKGGKSHYRCRRFRNGCAAKICLSDKSKTPEVRDTEIFPRTISRTGFFRYRSTHHTVTQQRHQSHSWRAFEKR